MKTKWTKRAASLRSTGAAFALAIAALAAAAPADAQPRAYASGTYRPSQQVHLSVGEGQMIILPRSVANVWTSNPKVADVYVSSPRQMNVFGKEMGEATVIATAAKGNQSTDRIRSRKWKRCPHGCKGTEDHRPIRRLLRGLLRSHAHASRR